MNYFWNFAFDKGRLKNFVLWFFSKYGEHKTVCLLDSLKSNGFTYATKAGISLGIDDLKIPPRKALLIAEAEKQTKSTINQYKRGEITGVERFQQIISTWHETSENIKQEVIEHFKRTDILNPVFMMAFSGARGNVSQVRQLVGMRGLMADPQGKILDFPIRSNFKEGLTLTEYIISCYGARKGIVDTALRTANAGYLTRRLVDVAQHVIVSQFDCGTKRGIVLTKIKEGNSVILTLKSRIVGRVLAQDVFQIATQISDWVGPSSLRLLKLRNLPTLAPRVKNPNIKRAGRDATLLQPLSAPLGLRMVGLNQRSLLSLLLPSSGDYVAASKKKWAASAVLFQIRKRTAKKPYLSGGVGELQQSLLILARSLPGRDLLLSQRNQEITMELAAKLARNQPKIFVRSSLTCESLNNNVAEYSIRDLSTTVGKPCLISPKGFAGASLSKYLDTNFILSPKNLLGKGAEIRTNTISTGIPSPFICQLCYGWSLAQGNLVSIGEAVGIIAAQAIGEPGTQLTMRTFHTGGVFSGDVSKQIRAPFNGYAKFPKTIPGTLIRTSEGRIAFLTKTNGHIIVKPHTSIASFQDLPRSPIGLAAPPGGASYFGHISLIGNCSPPCSSAAEYVGPFSPCSESQGSSLADTPNRRSGLGAMRGQQLPLGCPKIRTRREISDFNPSGKGKTIEQRGFAIPAFTLLFVRNGETVFFKQVIAQTSNFEKNQLKKKDVERIINAEIDGQLVFSNFKMKDLLSVLKKAELITDSVPCSESQGAGRSPFIKQRALRAIGTATLFLNLEREQQISDCSPLRSLIEGGDYMLPLSQCPKGAQRVDLLLPWLSEQGGNGSFIAESGRLHAAPVGEGEREMKQSIATQRLEDWVAMDFENEIRESLKKWPNSQPLNQINHWTFGYILSAKIYQLAIAASFFPTQGDYIGLSFGVWPLTGLLQVERTTIVKTPEISDREFLFSPKGRVSSARGSHFFATRKIRNHVIWESNKKLQQGDSQRERHSCNTWLLSKRNAWALINKSPKSFLTQIKLRLKKSVTNFPPCASEKGFSRVNNISLLRIQNVQFNKFLGNLLKDKSLKNLFLSFNKSICIPRRSRGEKKIEQMPCLVSILYSYYDLSLFLPRAVSANWGVWAVLAIWGMPKKGSFIPRRSRGEIMKETITAPLMYQPGHDQVVELFDPTRYISIWYKNKNKNCRFDAKIRSSKSPKKKDHVVSQRTAWETSPYLFARKGENEWLQPRGDDPSDQSPAGYFRALTGGIIPKVKNSFNANQISALALQNKKARVGAAPLKGRGVYAPAAFLKYWAAYAAKEQLKSLSFGYLGSPSKVKISDCSLKGVRGFSPFRHSLSLEKGGYTFDAGGDRILFQEGALANTKMFFGQKNVHLNLFSKLNMNKIAFSSPFQGEILNISKKKCLVLTKWDKISFFNLMGPKHPIGDLGSIIPLSRPVMQGTTGTLALTPQSKIKLGDYVAKIRTGCNQRFARPITCAPFGYREGGISQSPAAQRVLGHFLVYGNLLLDKNFDKAALKTSGQIISLNKMKITLRRSQPVFLSPNAIVHKNNGAFVTKNTPLMTLPFQVLTTGDIVQGIPKIEQFFEARTTKNGRFFRESIPNLLILLFQRYKTRFPLNQAVRQSFYKIQQIIIDGVQRVYRSQGVTLADKHIEIIVKQMTKKVVLTKSGQSGFLVGELLDLEFVEKINQELIQKMHYEPIILGITKASLRVESFLSAASFQQTTKVLSRAAIAKKRDFLLGLKESVILGNIIPAGTGYLKEHQRS